MSSVNTRVVYTDGLIDVTASNKIASLIEVRPVGDKHSLCLTLTEAESLINLLRQAAAQIREWRNGSTEHRAK